MPLTPPPDEIFPTMYALIDSTKTHAGNRGYALAILYKVWLKCDRGGKYRARGLTEDTQLHFTAIRCTPFKTVNSNKKIFTYIIYTFIGTSCDRTQVLYQVLYHLDLCLCMSRQ